MLHAATGPGSQAEGRGVAGRAPGRVQGAMPWRWPSQAGSIEEREGIQQRECPFVSEQRARLALMRQLFVAGLSTSSGLVDSLTWLLQIKQAGTRDAYDSTLKAPLNPPTVAIIPPPPPSPLFPPVSQASQGSSDRRKSASGLFQVSQIRDGGDFHLPYSVSFIPWALISFWRCTVTWFLLKNEWTGFACLCGTDVVCWCKCFNNCNPSLYVYRAQYSSSVFVVAENTYFPSPHKYHAQAVNRFGRADFVWWWIKWFWYLNTGQYAFVFYSHCSPNNLPLFAALDRHLIAVLSVTAQQRPS